MWSCYDHRWRGCSSSCSLPWPGPGVNKTGQCHFAVRRRTRRARAEVSLAWARRRLTHAHFHDTSPTPLVQSECVDLVTVAFNSAQLIAHQHRLLQKYFSDPFRWTVADNSPDPAQRAVLARYCDENAIAYIGLNRNYYTGRDPSRSHGEAMNVVYRQYLRPRGAAAVGFIDHDIFPIRPFAVMHRLASYPVYGRVQTGENAWYLWPGLCFFARPLLASVGAVDFHPWNGCDTGAGNYPLVYSHLDPRRLEKPPEERLSISVGGERTEEFVELIGDWLHTMNGSGWRPDRGTGKQHFVQDLLAKIG